MQITQSIEEEMLVKSELLKAIATLRIDRRKVKQEEMVVIMTRGTKNTRIDKGIP